MARKFKELLDKMTPERRAAIKAGANRLRAGMSLIELREARALTQVQLAEKLGVRQPSISQMERRTDMYLRSLRKFVQAMGGELEIRAVFPSGPVRILQLGEPRGKKGAAPGKRRRKRRRVA
jgi:transcriptional regulator with XRE-family HTH domain